MAVALTGLIPDFRAIVEVLLETLRQDGFEMRPVSTVRDPFTQAKLWRQSRSTEEIAKRVSLLTAQGAHFLAHCLTSVGPQHGPHVTNALPGFSWHQWGEALDCMWVANGKSVNSPDTLIGGKNGYHVYAEHAHALGLTAGGYWSGFEDWPHVQLRTASSPMAQGLQVAEIDRVMKERFGQ